MRQFVKRNTQFLELRTNSGYINGYERMVVNKCQKHKKNKKQNRKNMNSHNWFHVSNHGLVVSRTVHKTLIGCILPCQAKPRQAGSQGTWFQYWCSYSFCSVSGFFVFLTFIDNHSLISVHIATICP